MNTEITQDLLRTYFDYKDGELFYKPTYKTPAGRISKKAGKSARLTPCNGYYRINVPRIGVQKEHRMIFLYHEGYLPEVVDHIDRDKENNRIENLRASNLQDNAINRSISKSNTSGIVGVHYDESYGKWVVTYRGKYFGRFDTKEEAAKVNANVRALDQTRINS